MTVGLMGNACDHLNDTEMASIRSNFYGFTNIDFLCPDKVIVIDLTDEETETARSALNAESGKYEYELPTGDVVAIEPAESATITHVAETTVENAFTYELENADQYSGVSTNAGTLSVTPATLTIVTDSAEKEYDGQPLTAEGRVTGYKNNETADFTVTGTITEVGNTPNSYTIVFKGE